MLGSIFPDKASRLICRMCKKLGPVLLASCKCDLCPFGSALLFRIWQIILECFAQISDLSAASTCLVHFACFALRRFRQWMFLPVGRVLIWCLAASLQLSFFLLLADVARDLKLCSLHRTRANFARFVLLDLGDFWERLCLLHSAVMAVRWSGYDWVRGFSWPRWAEALVFALCSANWHVPLGVEKPCC